MKRVSSCFIYIFLKFFSGMRKDLRVSALHLPIPTDQRVGAPVVLEVGLACGFEFGDDA